MTRAQTKDLRRTMSRRGFTSGRWLGVIYKFPSWPALPDPGCTE